MQSFWEAGLFGGISGEAIFSFSRWGIAETNDNPSAFWTETPHMIGSGTPGLPGGAPI